MATQTINADAMSENIQREIKNGAWQKAEEMCAEMLRQDPHHLPTLNLLGALLIKGRKFEAAIPVLHKSLELQPDQINTLHNAASALHAMGKQTQALALMQRALKLKPDFVEGYYLVALAYYELAHNQQALRAFNKVLELNPNFPRIHFLMGNIYSQIGDYEKSLKEYEIAKKQQPSDPTVVTNLGITLFEMERFEEAITNLEIALQLQPNNLEAFRYLDMSLQSLGKYGEWVSATAKALQITSDSSEIFKTAILKMHKHELQEADSICADMLKAHPENTHVWNLKAVAAARANKLDDALQHIMKSTDVEMPNSFHCINRGNLHRMKEEFDQAIVWYQKALKVTPDSKLAEHLLRTTQISQYVRMLKTKGKGKPKKTHTKKNAVPKIAVYSLFNSSNPSNRLAYHLLPQILPVKSELHMLPIYPFEYANLKEMDLVILGMGDTLFQRTFNQSKFMDFFLSSKKTVGIFGTQYADTLPSKEMNALVKHCDIWFARYEEDIKHFGKNSKKVHHLGDWLINLFPMTTWEKDETLHLNSQEILQIQGMDQFIQRVQKYRNVFSPRLMPLLCALCSAEMVSYREQHHYNNKPSGKFQHLLMDIFGKPFPEDEFFTVDRNKVMEYKEATLKRTEKVREEIQNLLS